MTIRTVLAEDQGMVLGAFASLLALEPDIEVVATAADGDEALAAVMDAQPDVLLTDIEMPGRSGLDVAAELGRTAAVAKPLPPAETRALVEREGTGQGE